MEFKQILLLPKNQNHRKMFNSFHIETCNEPQPSSSTNSAEDTCTISEKYKSGFPSQFSSFRLYEASSQSQQISQETPSRGNKSRGFYRKYTCQEKELAVLKIQQGYDVKEISKIFGIPRRNLLRWKKNGCERKEGGGRPTDHDMEKILYEKIQKGEINGQKQIRGAAVLASKSQNFKASKGWFSKFSRRYKNTTGKDLIKH